MFSLLSSENQIIEAIHSYKESVKELQDLERYATNKWGELYWLNEDFHDSSVPAMMEKHNADVDYYLHQFNSTMHLN